MARKGEKQSPEHVAKRAAALRGKKRTPEQRARIAEATRQAMARPDVRERQTAGQARPEVRQRLSESKRGPANPMYGKPVSEATRRKRSEALQGKHAHEQNPAWKGDDASQSAFHAWLRHNYPYTGVCEECGEERRTEWAFLRWPEPYTRDRDDYREMCRSCHTNFDYSTGQREKAALAGRTGRSRPSRRSGDRADARGELAPERV